MQVAYIGNFEPEHSTENDLASTMEEMGVEVRRVQEGDPRSMQVLDQLANPDSPVDLLLWTSTKSLADRWDQTHQREMLFWFRRSGIPTAAIHLDRWWGLSRQWNVLSEPWFSCDWVFTADGAHDKEFEAAGIRHVWSPPAIAPKNAHRGTVRREFVSDLAFVGNHFPGHYHDEWTHRGQLIQWLNRHYRGRCVFYPRKTSRGIEPAIRGDDLADLYASAKVIIGDSCLVPTVDGDPMHHYCSDRVFETIGRGGLLLHPVVEGVVDIDGLVSPGQHCLAWQLGDFADLGKAIEFALSDLTWVDGIREEGFHHVKANHTYRNRLTEVFRITNKVDIP